MSRPRPADPLTTPVHECTPVPIDDIWPLLVGIGAAWTTGRGQRAAGSSCPGLQQLLPKPQSRFTIRHPTRRRECGQRGIVGLPSLQSFAVSIVDALARFLSGRCFAPPRAPARRRVATVGPHDIGIAGMVAGRAFIGVVEGRFVGRWETFWRFRLRFRLRDRNGRSVGPDTFNLFYNDPVDVLAVGRAAFDGLEAFQLIACVGTDFSRDRR